MKYILVGTYNFLNKDNYESTTNSTLITQFNDMSEMKAFIEQNVKELADQEATVRFGFPETLDEEGKEQFEDFCKSYIYSLIFYNWESDLKAEVNYDDGNFVYNTLYYVFEL